jgi:pimeloyl-ACP methyl ester carboxylesterase
MGATADDQRVTTRDGRTLAYRAVGEGEPTVVFEAGMGSSGRAWGLVQHEVGRQVRAVTYDRAGFGASSPDPAGRALERVVADLIELLEHLGGRRAVLVAHSWGGPVVRTLAAARPDLVAGLVLVDQTDERCDLYFSGSTMAQQRRLARMLPGLARVGLVRLGIRRLTRAFPPDLRADLLASDASVAGARVMSTELASFEADITRLRDEPPALPPVPVTWLSGTKRPRLGAAVRTCLAAAHRASAAAHPGGRHVEAPRSGHYVHWSEPELVVAEVLRLATPS